MSKQRIPDALPIQHRAATVSGFDYDKRTVTFALTSETPVDRWYGEEILDHSDGSIDDERLKRGIPLLFNHDSNQHIGRIESYEVKDKKLYVTARFGNSPLAQQKLDDVRDGILVDASGGYIPRDYQFTEGKKGSPDTVRWTNWMPCEGSLCPVPADPTVGIGRSADGPTVPAGTPIFPVRNLGATTPVEVANTEAVEEPAAVDVRSNQSNPAQAENKEEVSMSANATGHNEAVAAERQRVSEINAIASRYSKFLNSDQRDKFISEETSVDAVRKFVMDKQVEEAQSNEVRNLNPLGLSEAEQRNYSITAALRAASGDAQRGFEHEVSDALAKATGRTPRENGLFIPMNMKMRAGDLDRIASRNGLPIATRAANDTSSSNGNGAATIFTEFVSLIELLRSQVKVRQMGATFLAGLTGNIAFPKQTGATTASWVADNPGSDVADSNISFAQMSMTPKILQASTGFSRLLLQQSSVDVEALIRMDLTAVAARAIDLASLVGTGLNNQPKGILNQTGIGSIVTGGSALSFDHITEFETQIAEANADVLGTMGYLTTPRVRKKLKNAPELANTIALPIWRDGEVNGYRADVTNQLPKPMSSGGSPYAQHAMIAGVWSELLIGEWVAYEVITDPFRLKKQGVVEVTTYDTCDVNVRHPQSFVAATDINPNA
ncbi:phage major capsid protein [Edaphobacter albus]|uniref:phage major capsid protein n=1 Tax=Edaphobacter sp. 4G125 TaxID=2763071 RepID=UPI0016458969|nr:phage major capsid protein [Edaphobacter sp. 4G125]QNI37518.1 phage major capsid protein [Edaphobacter sp. 4G125]